MVYEISVARLAYADKPIKDGFCATGPYIYGNLGTIPKFTAMTEADAMNLVTLLNTAYQAGRQSKIFEIKHMLEIK